ncbi:hypothetical protein KFE25_002394 [Diacronema lutheri]|uniref:2Fe-2S ferredoxin-type domain-containing protein n=1 Tax=Diacronema lutheri TaxID=2081491 RepID=A0A8J5XEB1_DIALT|nr:hypothetical protein KFE25_002394 [Diacronema lutheri]
MAGTFAAVLALACGFAPPPRAAPARWNARTVTMKDWSKRETLADKAGGLMDKGAEAVGLIGTVPVEFVQGNNTLKTMAMANQPLSEVAAQAGQFIKYKCGKGECGTCEVRVDGQWIRTCSTRVPGLSKGEVYRVHVRGTMVQSKKSSRFFSIRSFFAGFKNNVLGMVGFVREGRKSGGRFNERLSEEARIAQIVADKKAAKARELEGAKAER